MDKQPSKTGLFARFSISEDWLAVLIAAIIIFLTVLGILGPRGIPVSF